MKNFVFLLCLMPHIHLQAYSSAQPSSVEGIQQCLTTSMTHAWSKAKPFQLLPNCWICCFSGPPSVCFPHKSEWACYPSSRIISPVSWKPPSGFLAKPEKVSAGDVTPVPPADIWPGLPLWPHLSYLGPQHTLLIFLLPHLLIYFPLGVYLPQGFSAYCAGVFSSPFRKLPY